MKKVLIYWFSFLLILLWFSSCASRKTQKNTTETAKNTTAKVEQKNDVVATTTENQNVQKVAEKSGSKVTETTTITPIDMTKPTTVTDSDGNTKTIQNGVYINKRETTNTNVKEDTKASKSSASKVVDQGITKFDLNAKSKSKDTIKQTSRSYFSWWFLLLIIIPSGLYIYWRIKK